MILVTVGSTHFDELIREVDRLVGVGQITEEVFSQIGTGTYEPVNMKWARYLPNILPWFAKADLVITHGGATVFELLGMGKRFIAVPNRSLQDDHQTDFLKAVDACQWGICCFGLEDLGRVLQEQRPLKPYPPRPELPPVVWQFLREAAAARRVKP